MTHKKQWGNLIFMTVLSGICAAVWLYRVFARGEHDFVTAAAGILWAACALIWGFRAVKVWRKSRKS